MTAHRAFRLAALLLAMALIGSCRKVEEGGDGGPTGPGGGGSGGAISAVASPAAILGNGIETSEVTATVFDSEGDPVGAGVSVGFSASRGTITGSSLTDANGQARAVYTSGVGAGEARINITATGASGYATVTLTSGSPAEIVKVAVARLTIGVRGTDVPQSSTITFQVRDAQGIPVGPGTAVSFALTALTNDGAGSGESLEPTSDITDDEGVVRTVLLSGDLAGVTETIARTVVAGPDTVVSRSVRISINTSLPVGPNLTVASEELNIPGRCFANVRTEVLALAFDQFHNPVATGTIVYFTTQYGGIQAADTTDDHGAATVNLISGNELPPDWPGGVPAGFPYGFTEVIAQTADEGGAQIRDTTLVLFSGCTLVQNLSPSSFNIVDGDCQTFTFNVWDLNHNPLSAGTNISITSSGGTLAGALDVTLGDIQVGGTSYAFALCDDDPGDGDPPVSVSVTIEITSRNGDVTVTILGTID